MCKQTVRHFLVPCALLGWSLLQGQTAPGRYGIILEDAPISERFAVKQTVRSAEAISYERQIDTKQKAIRGELSVRKIHVTGAVNTVLNAVFVVAPQDRVAELKTLPGVKGVVPLKRYHMELNRATQVLNAPAAWNALGGLQSAGQGMKIAVLDSGIDQTHPAFQDNALPMPGGYPLCSGSDCAFTSNKIIVARSYVRQLSAGSAPNPAADSRPDDYSPRDRDGHGTAVASCAAGAWYNGSIQISGMAPKAYLGNYKIYGSPGLNDGTTDDVIIQAAEDAVKDGMDIITFSSGSPALSGPLDSGAVCGNNAGVPCDLVAQTFENVARNGVVVVAAAGNEGQDGVSADAPSFNSISSPADAPSVIAAGAITNSHSFGEIVTVPGSDAPANLRSIATVSGDANVPPGAITGPLRDVTQFGDNGLACATLPTGSLIGSIALIERGDCTFDVKLSNAIDAGAIAVIFYMADQSAMIAMGGLASFVTPAVMISNADGLALKSFAETHPGNAATLDPAGIEQNAQTDEVAGFSSIGPTTGDAALKPDVLAVGTNVYMAGESYDPSGALFSSNRDVVANGTSFSTPLVAGAAALVKQKHPGFTPDQVRSALMTTAANILTDDAGKGTDARWAGAGKLDTGAAVAAGVTVTPASLSFGRLQLNSSFASKQIQITNSGSAAVNLNFSILPANTSSGTLLKLDRQNLSLAPGASGTVTASLSGGAPAAGAFSGNVVVQGAGGTLRIPYLYTVPSSTPANLIPLTGIDSDGTIGGGIAEGIISVKLVDSSGLPIAGAPVSFTARTGGSYRQADQSTDRYGIAYAEPVLGTQTGLYTFTAIAGNLRASFSEFARPRPTIADGGVADAATFDRTGPFAPGSYVTIFGAALSDFSDYAESATLPLQIDQTHVSFDVPSAGISVPGHLIYVSPTQVNVQIPWELRGQSSVQVKVSINYSDGNVITLPLADAAPSLFAGEGGMAAALDATSQVVTSANPARQGQTLQLFANGLGPVVNQPGSGDPAPSYPLASTMAAPVVTIGGQNAPVVFSGLAPGFAGLYQVNVTVPSGLSPGLQPVSVAMGGRTSKTLNVAVQ
jgi:minor extracellular serine protease Vpr